MHYRHLVAVYVTAFLTNSLSAGINEGMWRESEGRGRLLVVIGQLPLSCDLHTH